MLKKGSLSEEQAERASSWWKTSRISLLLASQLQSFGIHLVWYFGHGKGRWNKGVVHCSPLSRVSLCFMLCILAFYFQKHGKHNKTKAKTKPNQTKTGRQISAVRREHIGEFISHKYRGRLSTLWYALHIHICIVTKRGPLCCGTYEPDLSKERIPQSQEPYGYASHWNA